MAELADDWPKGRILVVDDEDVVREIICAMLSSAGYEHHDVGSGADALAVLQSGVKFQLLLTGMMMPEMDGIQLLEHVRRGYPDVTVVFATGVNDATVMETAFRGGAAGYLLKPFSCDELLEVIQKALRSR